MQTAAFGSADPNTILAGPATGSVTGPQGFRALAAGDLTAANVIAGLASSIRAAASSASVTGTLAINTGLATLTNVVINIRGALVSSAVDASWSPLASSGWFSALVYAQATATNVAPLASTLATTIDYIAFGT